MPLAFVLVALGTVLLFVQLLRPVTFLPRAAFALLLAAMLVIPLAWSALTVAAGDAANLPAAYAVSAGPNGAPRKLNFKTAASTQVNAERRRAVNEELLAYLEANTQGMEYLVAVESAQAGAPYVLATGRPVLYMGGFGGGDSVVSADDLMQMVANGELRFVLSAGGGGGKNNKQDIVQWLQSSCAVVEQFSQTVSVNSALAPQGQNQGGQVLYDCR